MTVADTARVAGSPIDLDLRRQVRQARDEVRALRAYVEALGCDLDAAEHRYAELHVAYLELLTHARAAAAAAARGEIAPTVYIAGHLEEIGLAPDRGAQPERLVAEGLAVAVRLQGGGGS